LYWHGIAALVLNSASDLDFQSASPSVVKSIKQRDLLNTWLRLYARGRLLPRVEDYQPERLADELPDLVYYTVDTARQPPRLTIQSDGTRMSDAYGNTGKGRYLDQYLGPRLKPVVMPVYYECLRRALPAYTHLHDRRHLWARRRLGAAVAAVLERQRCQRYHRFAEDHQRRRRF
jgi:hypothetical protein